MKSLIRLFAVAAVASLTAVASAESSLTLTGVHNCCKSCAKGIDGAVTGAGATAAIDGTTVTITAPDEAGAKKAAEALVAAGYYGVGATAPAIADAKVKSATVSSVHLCCGKCVTAVEKAVLTVPGVTSHTATKGATSFTVDGDFSTKELAAALNKAGFSGGIK
jgi:copper chaperone CopZ